jgi:hypothetical protein
MHVKIHYDIATDNQYLVMFSEDYDRSRTFFGGPNPINVPRGENPPESVKHAITTLQMLALLDALLAEGMRPSSNEWSAGHVKDLKQQIDFLQGLVAKLTDNP